MNVNICEKCQHHERDRWKGAEGRITCGLKARAKCTPENSFKAGGLAGLIKTWIVDAVFVVPMDCPYTLEHTLERDE